MTRNNRPNEGMAIKSQQNASAYRMRQHLSAVSNGEYTEYSFRKAGPDYHAGICLSLVIPFHTNWSTKARHQLRGSRVQPGISK